MNIPLATGECTAEEKLSALLAGRIPHAILLEGDDRAACESTSQAIAKMAVCTGETPPCGDCRGCRMAENRSHPDIAVIAPEEKKKNIAVSQIRTLRQEAYVKPHMANHKVFIIAGADTMNDQSQNALLKVLEEPPGGVIFILITESKSALLETVISRCTPLALSPGGDTSSSENAEIREAAEKFLLLPNSGSEFEMLQLTTAFEKDRVGADLFLKELKLCTARTARESRKNTAKTRALLTFYSELDKFEDSLKTNINLPLLFCSLVCRAKETLS